MKYLSVLFIIFIFCSCSRSQSELYIKEPTHFHSKFSYNDDNFYIGIKTTGFQDKVQFLDLYKNVIELDNKNKEIIQGNVILTAYIEFDTDENFRVINKLTDIVVNEKNRSMVIRFDNGKEQIISLIGIVY